MKDSRRTHGNETLNTIIYLAIYLPILACAIVSIPFGRQNKMIEKDQLEQLLQSYQTTAKTQEEDISNLAIKLEFFKGEKIKKHAEKLGLKRRSDDQIVYLNRQNTMPAYLRENTTQPQNQTFQTATAVNAHATYNRN